MVPTPVLANATEIVRGAWSPGQFALTGMRALRNSDTATGAAYTVRIRRARERRDEHVDLFLRAFDAAPRGCVVVVEAVDDVGGAVLGDIVAHRLKQIGVAGVVVSGPVRDLAGLEQFGPAVWYRETTMTGLELAESLTETGVALSVGGTAVMPGDLVFADVDGAFVVPVAAERDVRGAAAQVQAREDRWHKALGEGRTLMETLRNKSTAT